MKKTKSDGSRTIYAAGGVYEVDKVAGGAVKKTTTYYPVAGTMRIVEGAGNNLYYILKDHLGSASVITNASGTIVGENRYYPYGETRLSTGTMYTDKLYTGQREILFALSKVVVVILNGLAERVVRRDNLFC